MFGGSIDGSFRHDVAVLLGRAFYPPIVTVSVIFFEQTLIPAEGPP